MKVALIVYHRNASSIYPIEWINSFAKSVVNQTNIEFDIFEIEYGGGEFRIFGLSYYESIILQTFVHAMNYLLDKCFSLGYDCVANSNIDDYFSLDRFEKQLPYIENGYELVSSNFSLIKDDQIIHKHVFHNVDIEKELRRFHNPICHPVVMYSKSFWQKHRYEPEQIPLEDMLLWKRAVKNCKMIILEDNLCFHRIHDNSVCSSQNR